MLSPRWRKVLRDVWLHKSRTVLVVLAISVGLIGAGALLNTWALVRRATEEGFLASNPASATIRVDSVDAALLDMVRAMPAIKDVQARRMVMASAQSNGAWINTAMYAVDDFTAVRIGLLKPEAGEWPPSDGKFVVERSSVDFSGVSVGMDLPVALSRSQPVSLAVSGIVRDVGLAPGWMEHLIYGFVTRNTLRQLGAPSSLNEIQLVVREQGLDREAVRRIAFDVRRAIEGAGHKVTDVDVPEPGQHIHAAQMDSLLYTQGAFALMALVLSGFLVVNLIAAMLAGQVREIGIMKSIGARAGQVAGMYLGVALVLGAVASLISLPIAAYIGRQYAELKGELLNFEIGTIAIPYGVLAAQLIVGMLFPVAAAAFPVWKGCRISVAAALRDLGISDGDYSAGRLLSRASGVARPMLLSLRNAFRKRQRMALTLATLALGGGVFLGARNLRVSIRAAVDNLFTVQRFQFVLRLAEPHAVDSIESLVRGTAGVAGAEAWTGASASLPHEGNTTGNSFAITAPPAGTTMLGLGERVREGRWLRAGDSDALVISARLQKDEPTMRVGERVSLLIAGRATQWTIVGVVESGPQPQSWAPRETVAAITNGGRVSSVVVASSLAGAASQVELIQRLRGVLEQAGLPLTSSQLLEESRRVLQDHLLMVADFLGAMAWLMILVGGLGLASTMSLAVMERTREIGVMRAIGARHGAIHGIVQTEGLVISLSSWLIAIPISVPMSIILGKAFGRVMLPVPTRYLPEWSGVGVWFLVVVLVSLVACALPAWRATRITTAAALAYE